MLVETSMVTHSVSTNFLYTLSFFIFNPMVRCTCVRSTKHLKTLGIHRPSLTKSQDPQTLTESIFKKFAVQCGPIIYAKQI